MNKDNKKKKPKTFMWYLDKLLILTGAVLVITGIVMMVIATENDDTEKVFIGVVMLPGAGILMTPSVIMSALRESKGWRDKAFSSKKLLKEDFFREVSDPSPYHKRICRAVIREASLNFLALIGFLVFIIFIGVITLEGGIDDGAFVFFLVLLGLLIFAVPMLAYNITCAVYRIRIALRREYLIYHSQVKTVSGYDMKIVGKLGVYKFKYCKCLGIRADDIYETNAILTFVPDEVFLFPEEER